MNVCRAIFTGKSSNCDLPYRRPAISAPKAPHVPFCARSAIVRPKESNRRVLMPPHVAKSIKTCGIPIHTYVEPYDATFLHPDFIREDFNTSSDTFTLGFARALPLCRPSSECPGCIQCVKDKCFWCKELLSSGSSSYDNCKDSLVGSVHEVISSRHSKYYYVVTLLTVPNRYVGERQVFMTDSAYDVCADCVHTSIADRSPICHDPDTYDCLYKFYCKEIEDRLIEGQSKRFAEVDLYSYRSDGSYFKLTPKQVVKVLGTCHYQNLQDEDQIVSYGQLEEDPIVDKHIVLPKLDLTPSEIAKLVADCSE